MLLWLNKLKNPHVIHKSTWKVLGSNLSIFVKGQLLFPSNVSIMKGLQDITIIEKTSGSKHSSFPIIAISKSINHFLVNQSSELSNLSNVYGN